MTTVGTLLLAGVALAALASTLAWWRTRPGRDLSKVALGSLALGAALAAATTALLQGALVGWLPATPYTLRVSGAELPVYYRVSSMWSALEGSLLLWLLVLAGVSLAGARSAGPSHRRVAGLTLSAGVTAFAGVALVASPFAASDGGPSPSPLLQDHPAMGVHPPLLYAGFAAAAVPHALAVAAAYGAAVDRAWARRVRRWSLLSWVLLTAGIGLGAWWSYAVLGWGGYWAWDPVENASLLPWLVMTALLHALLPAAGPPRRRGVAVVLAGLGYTLVLLAQFLTRSGVVQSVHAFTESPLGPVLLLLTVVGGLAWLVPLLLRPGGTPSPPRPGPRRSALTANTVALLCITAIVLVGTVLPTILAMLTGHRVAVGSPWYARTLSPLALVLLVLMVVATWLPAGRTSPGRLVDRTWPLLVAGGVTAGAAGLLVRDAGVAVLAALAVVAVLTLAVRAVRQPARRRLGGLLAHVGVAVGGLAVVAGGQGAVSEATVPVGGSVAAGPVSATLVDLQRGEEGRRVVVEATVLLTRGDALVGTGHPALHWYDDQSTMLTSPAIRTGLLDDVYVTLLDVDPGAGEATLRLARTPLIGWLWASGGLLVLGGTVAGLPRRARTPRDPGVSADPGSPRRGLVGRGPGPREEVRA